MSLPSPSWEWNGMKNWFTAWSLACEEGSSKAQLLHFHSHYIKKEIKGSQCQLLILLLSATFSSHPPPPTPSASIVIILMWKPSLGWSQMPDEVRGTAVQVLPNGVVVHGSGCGHKQVPDGMGEWNDAVALEEHNSQAVNQASTGKLLKSVSVIHWCHHQGWRKSHREIEEEFNHFILFMVEKYINGSPSCHEPDKPTHVRCQGSKFTEI